VADPQRVLDGDRLGVHRGAAVDHDHPAAVRAPVLQAGQLRALAVRSHRGAVAHGRRPGASSATSCGSSRGCSWRSPTRSPGWLLCITIIGIPFGIQSFKFVPLALFPFGKEIVRSKDLRDDIGVARAST
jgi:hypothetical protein